MIHQRGHTWMISFFCTSGHRHRIRAVDESGVPVRDRRSAERAYYQAAGKECPVEKRQRERSEDEARRAEAERRRLAQRPFTSVADEYLKWKEMKQPDSLKSCKSAMAHLKTYFETTPLKAIEASHVEAYVAVREGQGAANGTINRERSVLSGLFERAIKLKYVTANPVRDTDVLKEPKGKPRPIKPEEEAVLLAHLPAGKRAWPFWRKLILLDVNTGLRLKECRYQAWRDIDLVENTLRVTRPKSRAPDEVIPLNDTAKAILASLPRQGPLLFPTMPKKVSDMFKKIVTRAKLPADITFHCMRDTFISRVAPHLKSEASVMQLARHRDFRTTLRYLKIDRSHLRPGVEALDQAAPGGTQVAIADELLKEVFEKKGE